MLFSNGLIGLREGLEAALVVSILVAFLVRSERRSALPAVWAGVAAAVVLSVAVTAVLVYAVGRMTFRQQEIFGGLSSLVAVVFVTWMIFWMRRAARTIAAQLRGKLSEALQIGPLAVAAVAFVAVVREGVETAVFFFASMRSAGAGSVQPLLGLLLGIAVAVVLAWLLYQGAIKLDLGAFFTATGCLLVFVAAGVLAYGVHDLQEASLLPGLHALAFDISAQIPAESWYGTLLNGIFNFSPDPSVLEVVAWLGYVVVVLALFLLPGRMRRSVLLLHPVRARRISS